MNNGSHCCILVVLIIPLLVSLTVLVVHVLLDVLLKVPIIYVPITRELLVPHVALVCLVVIIIGVSFFFLHHLLNIEPDLLSKEVSESFSNVMLLSEFLGQGIGIVILSDQDVLLASLCNLHCYGQQLTTVGVGQRLVVAVTAARSLEVGIPQQSASKTISHESIMLFMLYLLFGLSMILYLLLLLQ